MNSSFLRADGTLAPPRGAWWFNWLPSLSQIQQAIQLRFETYSESTASTPASLWALTMRQGLGLVVVSALLAGFLPFLVNSTVAMRQGAPLPFVQLAERAATPEGEVPSLLDETLTRLAGLSPSVLPGWLAALLSTVGEWINWPLRWLTWWLVYGTAVLLAAKAWGVSTTLQRFLAVTSYAAVPMILTGLGPVPCLGIVAQIGAVVWMLAVYVTSVRALTGLDWGRTVVAVLLPAAALCMLAIAFGLAVAVSVLRMVF